MEGGLPQPPALRSARGNIFDFAAPGDPPCRGRTHEAKRVWIRFIFCSNGFLVSISNHAWPAGPTMQAELQRLLLSFPGASPGKSGSRDGELPPDFSTSIDCGLPIRSSSNQREEMRVIRPKSGGAKKPGKSPRSFHYYVLARCASSRNVAAQDRQVWKEEGAARRKSSRVGPGYAQIARGPRSVGERALSGLSDQHKPKGLGARRLEPRLCGLRLQRADSKDDTGTFLDVWPMPTDQAGSPRLRASVP